MADVSGIVETRMERRLSAILAADIAGYSALMGADEARTVRDLKGHQAVVLPMVGEFAGRIIDTAGDGILAEFASVINAVKCALAIQTTMAQRNAAIEPQRRMQFRVGINIGDVVYDDVRIYGDGINVAARLEGIAEAGGICISSKVYDEINGRMDLACQDIGEQQLKTIARPVRAYHVRLDSVAPTAVPAPALPDKPSIAVLPFLNMSGDPEQEYFADGMSEDLITSKVSGLFVIARNSIYLQGQSGRCEASWPRAWRSERQESKTDACNREQGRVGHGEPFRQVREDDGCKQQHQNPLEHKHGVSSWGRALAL